MASSSLDLPSQDFLPRRRSMPGASHSVRSPVWRRRAVLALPYPRETCAGDGRRRGAAARWLTSTARARLPEDEAHGMTFPGVTDFFLWVPTVAEDGFPVVSRNQLLMHVSANGILTATSFPFDLPTAVSLGAEGNLSSSPFPASVTYRVLALLRDRYEFVSVRHEDEIRRLEEFRVTGRGTLFLGDAFRLQQEISSASADLWRLKGVVRKLADGKLPLPGADTRHDPVLDNILSDIDDLDNEFTKLKEDLKSLMELHMNVTSFEMNKFMKLLAVVGFLGLIPSVAGGLLGMNVLGNPWSVSLGQVAFGVGMGMAISLYVFAIKGWLR